MKKLSKLSLGFYRKLDDSEMKQIWGGLEDAETCYSAPYPQCGGTCLPEVHWDNVHNTIVTSKRVCKPDTVPGITGYSGTASCRCVVE